MAERFHSPLWYRLKALTPLLHPQLEFSLHDYGGAPWIAVRNPFKGQVHRYPARLHRIVGALDGRQSVEALFAAALADLGADAPSQAEVVEVMTQLFRADLMSVPGLAPDLSEALERMTRERGQRRKKVWGNPVSFPVRLFDPDRLLDALAPLVRGRAGRLWAVAWLAAVLPALVLLPAQWPELTAGGWREWLSMQNLWLAALVYPVLKVLHELGHGLAVKRHGGEVHDCGVMFLVFYPVPYVDASAASFFPERGARLLVGAAGMLVELWLAALALLLWSTIEPGVLRDLCFVTMMIGGVSTLLFNGNPLLRFDGYHILADLLELPNLSAQTSKWWGWLLRNAFLRTQDRRGQARRRRDAWVFALYGPASLVYRLLIMLAIAGFVASRFFAVGLVIAAWGLWQSLGQPLVRILDQFRRDPALAARRGRAGGMAGAAALALLAVLFLVPLPLWTTAEGVVWLPDDARLRARTDGIVAAVHAADGQRLGAGTPVLRLHNPETEAQAAIQAARVAEARVALARARTRARSEMVIAAERLAQEETRLARARERVAELELAAPLSGLLSLPDAGLLPGRLLREGEVVGYVIPAGAREGGGAGARGAASAVAAPTGAELDDATPTGAGESGPAAGAGIVRAVVTQAQAELIAARLRGAEVLPVDGGAALPAQLTRLLPGASAELPSAALGLSGGGSLAVDPTDQAGTRALERLFALDLAVPDLPKDRFGGRVLVKLSFGAEPLALRLGRSARRALLRFFAESGG